MRASSTIVLLFGAAVIQALPIPNNYGGYSGAPAPASPPPGYDGFSLPPVNPYENGVPPLAGTEVLPPAESTEVPPPTESTEVPPPAGTEVPPPAESTEVPPPDESTEIPPSAGTEVPPPAESTEVPPPAGTEVPPPAESTEVPPPDESTEVPPSAGTEVLPPAESTEVPPPAGTEVPPPAESEVPSYDAEVPPTETEVPPATTDVPLTGTEVPPAATEGPPTVTEVPPAQTELPPTVHTTTPESASNYPQRLQRPVEIECRVSKTGFEPKEMSVKKGDTIKFKFSGGGKFGIRHGDDATACVPLQAGTATSGGLSYTVPEDASNKIIFYNVEGDKCSKTDMSATLNVASNLVADSPSLASGPPTTGGTLIRAPVRMSNAISNLPTLAFVGALSFIASLVQI